MVLSKNILIRCVKKWGKKAGGSSGLSTQETHFSLGSFSNLWFNRTLITVLNYGRHWKAKSGQNWKTFEGLHQKNTRDEGFELLAEVRKACNELWAKKAWEVSNHLCLENNPWTGAQLWTWLVRVWGKKGAIVWSEKTQRKILSANLRRQSFQIAGPRLWNCLPKNVRNFKGNQDEFKEILDQFLTKVPDEPKAEGLIPGATDVLNGKQTNTLIYQVTRRKEIWTDDDLEANATIVI